MDGRRRGFRRAGEGRNRYVDQLSMRILVPAFLTLALSAVDAWLTLVHLGKGAIEWNPLMSLVLDSGGVGGFLAVKSWGTGLGVMYLAAHQNYRVSSFGLHLLAFLYACLLGYHVFLLAVVP